MIIVYSAIPLRILMNVHNWDLGSKLIYSLKAILVDYNGNVFVDLNNYLFYFIYNLILKLKSKTYFRLMLLLRYYRIVFG